MAKTAKGKTSWYADNDSDGFGAGSATSACDAPAGRVSTNTDCNDVLASGGASVYPGAPESCADLAVDNDCDGTFAKSEASDAVAYYRDADADGVSVQSATYFCPVDSTTGYLATQSNPVDCNDWNSLVGVPASFYADADGDGFGAGTAVSSECARVSAQWTIPAAITTQSAPTYSHGVADVGSITGASLLRSVHASSASHSTAASTAPRALGANEK